MSAALLAIVTLIYGGIAAREAADCNWPMAAVFAGYTLANLGLMAAR